MTCKQTRRRYLLAVGAVGTAALAGCSESDSASDETATDGTATDGTATETTGADSDVTNRLAVINTVGSVDGDSISSVEVTVGRGPESGETDLSQTTISWVGSSGSYTLTSESSGTGDANFSVAAVQDEDGSIEDDGVLNDDADRAMVTIDLDAFGATLEEGSTATAQLTTPSGGSTELRIVVPETLSGQDAVSL